MESHEIAVDVISVCNADGSIRPLRLRLEQEDCQLLRIDIEEILNTKEIPYVGVEAIIFHCRGRIGDYSQIFDLKYLFRKHSWLLMYVKNKYPRIDCFGGISL